MGNLPIVIPKLPALAMPANSYQEQQWRNVDEKIDNLRRDLMSEVKGLSAEIRTLTILLYQTREQVTKIETNANAHIVWAEHQAEKISELEGQGIEQRIEAIENRFTTQSQNLRLDWWAWLFGISMAAAGMVIKALWDWLGGKNA